MTPLSPLAQKVLERAWFPQLRADKKAERYAREWADFAGLDEDEQDSVVDQYIAIAREENARLRPIIRELLQLVERQREALVLGRNYFTSIDTPSMCVTLRECELMRKEYVYESAGALTHTDEVMRKLGEG